MKISCAAAVASVCVLFQGARAWNSGLSGRRFGRHKMPLVKPIMYDSSYLTQLEARGRLLQEKKIKGALLDGPAINGATLDGPAINGATLDGPAINGMAARAPHRRPDKNIDSIYRQNQEWKNEKLAKDPDYFTNLGSTHKPDYMWIGCADARVPANEIMGEDAGSVFVVRNVANLVVGTDFNLMAALQFAVNVLKVPHIIVCGHYDCGGIRASMQRKDHVPPLENWLRNIRDVYRLHRQELDAIGDPEQRHRRLVELNVIEQCLNLFKTGAVQRKRVDNYKLGKRSRMDGDDAGEEFHTTPRIHACVFDPKTGDMNRLKVDFNDFITDLHHIYDLYTLDDESILEDKPHAPQAE